MIYGELLLGGFLKDKKLRESLISLPFQKQANPESVYQFILNQSLIGKGIGWVDCNILYDAINNSLGLITLDRKLQNLFNQLVIH